MYTHTHKHNTPTFETYTHRLAQHILAYVCMYTHTETHVRTYLVEVKHQVQFTDIAEELIQDLHKVVDGL